ncbi:ethylbenzene dehydrogenase-related protein [Aestuariirhabdus sp. LZHN29]|uniref:ethylbenzene dehydrogenase-related protein n=1 Tax=Aestuariirhabdus sp. LZHN29 TaxID=3417462 RepID=UPI003CE7306A
MKNNAGRGLFAPLLIASTVAWAAERPANTYFSMAVTENSHNHYGENLLYLDFSATAEDAQLHPRTVKSVRVEPGQIVADGVADEWESSAFTQIKPRVMNNYPLSNHRDATPTDIFLASAWDGEYLYFVAQWEDANRDASINRNRWIFKDGQWSSMAHTAARPGTAAATAVNRDDLMQGVESEDRAFFMFPIVDQQGNFKSGGQGCGGYCHANLAVSGDPAKAAVGDGSAAMHTTLDGDLADLWHWTTTRHLPMNTLWDGRVEYGLESYNGRKGDAGNEPFIDNALTKPFRPQYVHRGDLEAGSYSTPGFRTESLREDELVAITDEMTFAEGVSLPYYIGTPGTGSRNDVFSAATFDTSSGRWTLELKRKLITEDATHDRQFTAGVDAPAPADTLIVRGDIERGKRLFREKACAACHGDEGEGSFNGETWDYPRNQRTSAQAILNAASILRPHRQENVVHELKKWEDEPPTALMPYIILSQQEAEDIAAWLQTRYIPFGQ